MNKVQKDKTIINLVKALLKEVYYAITPEAEKGRASVVFEEYGQ